MALLDDKSFSQELEKQKFRSIYVLVGEEAGKMDYFSQTLEKSVLAGPRNSFNYESYYTDELKAASLLDKLQNVSLWQGRKLFVLKRLEKWPAKELEQLMSALDQDFGSSILVLMAEKIDGRGKFSQALNKSTLAGVLKCEALRDAELTQWLRLLCAKRSLRLSPEAREFLLRVGFGSVLDMDQALGKAALFQDGEEIDLPQLEKVQILGRPESVFSFTDAILMKRTKLALELLLQLERQGEEPLQLLALIAKQFRLMQQILALKQAGKNDAAIGSEMRMFPRQAQGLFAGLGKRNKYEIFGAVEQIAKADLEIKSTREQPYQILQRLSLSVCASYSK